MQPNQDNIALCCRFVAGLNAGALLNLEPGYYLFGNSDQAFFRLEQDNIVSEHFAIEVKPNLDKDNANAPFTLILHTLEGKVELNLTPIEPHQSVECKLYDVISCGLNDLIFALESDELGSLLDRFTELKSKNLTDQLQQKEEELKVKLEQEYASKLALAKAELEQQFKQEQNTNNQAESSEEKTSLEEASEKNDGSSDKEQKLDLNSNESDLTKDKTDALPEDNQDKVVSHELRDTIFSIRSVFLLIALVILGYFFYLLCFKSSPNKIKEDPKVAALTNSSLSDEERLNAFFKAYNVQNYKLGYENGAYKVTGSVQSNAQREEILSKLASFEGLALPIIVSLNEQSILLDDLNRAFLLRGAKFKLSSQEQMIKVSGYVQDQAALSVLVNSVNNLVYGYNLVYKTYKQPEIVARISKYVSQNKLKQKLNLDLIYTPYAIGYITNNDITIQSEINKLQSYLNQELDTYINFVEVKSLAVNYASLIYGLNNLALKNLSQDQEVSVGNIALGFRSNSLYNLKQNNQSLALIEQYYAGYLACMERLGVEAEAISRAYALPYRGLAYKGAREGASGYGLLNSLMMANQNQGSSKFRSNESDLVFNASLFNLFNHGNTANSKGEQEQRKGLLSVLGEQSQTEASGNQNLAVIDEAERNAELFSYLKEPPQWIEQNEHDGSTQNKDAFAESLDFDLMAVSMNPLPFISLRDGSKIFEGGILPFELGSYQYKVVKIEVDQLKIQRSDGFEFTYNLK